MTREEAIKIIQNEYKCVDRDCDIDRNCGKCDLMMLTKEPILKAYEMAISALNSLEEVYAKGYNDGFTQAEINIENDKSLSQEPTTTTNSNEPITVIYPTIVCDDAVSREDRLIDLANAIESDDSGYWTNKRISSALRNISSVTQKSGKWIYVREDKYSCSKCGTTTRVDEGGIDEKPMYKFCPYCGAKMESEDKE